MSWEDWLNESFAEYSALLVLRDAFGKAEYRTRVARKEQEAEDATSIWGFDRSDNAVAQNVLYNEGAVVLHDLSTRVSPPRFLEWCKALLLRKVSSTEEARELLRELEGDETAEWLEARLRQ